MPSDPSAHAQIRNALQDHAMLRGEGRAVIDATGTLTFDLLWQQARALASEQGPRSGAVIAIRATSNARFFVEVAAAWLRGGVPLPLDPKAPRPLVEAMIRRAAASTHQCDPWKAVFGVVGGTYRPLFTGGEAPTVPRKAHAVGLGSVGPALLASPLHLNGPFEFAIRQLLLGGTVVTLNRFDPVRWTQTAAATQPHWAFLAPIQATRLLDAVPGDTLRHALTGVRTVLHSAAPCPTEVRARLIDVVGAHRVAEYYGAADYDGTFARADATEPGAEPIAGAELRVVDGAGKVVPAGTEGRIEGRSPAGLVTHYSGEPCPAADTWRTVGDQGRQCVSGRLTITGVDVAGRAIVGGVNVPLARVRAVVCSHRAVLSCQVIPVADGEYGQAISVRATTDGSVSEQALAKYCAEHLRPAERPRHIHLDSPERPSEETADVLAM